MRCRITDDVRYDPEYELFEKDPLLEEVDVIEAYKQSQAYFDLKFGDNDNENINHR